MTDFNVGDKVKMFEFCGTVEDVLESESTSKSYAKVRWLKDFHKPKSTQCEYVDCDMLTLATQEEFNNRKTFLIEIEKEKLNTLDGYD